MRLTLSSDPGELSRRDPADLRRAAHAALDAELEKLFKGLPSLSSSQSSSQPQPPSQPLARSIAAGSTSGNPFGVFQPYINTDRAVQDGVSGLSIRSGSPPSVLTGPPSITPPGNAKQPILVVNYARHEDEQGRPLPANPVPPTFNPGLRISTAPPVHRLSASTIGIMVEQARTSGADDQARMRAAARLLIEDHARRRFGATLALTNQGMGVFSDDYNNSPATPSGIGPAAPYVAQPFPPCLTAELFLPQDESRAEEEDEDDLEPDHDPAGDEPTLAERNPPDRHGRSPVSALQ